MEKEIQSSVHDHPLIPRDNEDEWGNYCCVCERRISAGLKYGCNQCKEFIVHKSCAELPRQIQQPMHSKHPLTLIPKSPSYNPSCKACRKPCSGFVYHCADCHVHLDVGCSSLVPNINYEDHHHPLVYLERVYGDYPCDYCGMRCGAVVFGCVECNYHLHKSCAELVKKIEQPFHPLHPLILQREYGRAKCNACGGPIYGSGFCCERCDFHLHESCVALKPIIRYEGHNHLLSLIKYMSGAINHLCASCFDKTCDTFVFRCVECDFNLHAQCLPSFPRTIKHQCHVHPLTLIDAVVEEGYNRNDYYCDACEEIRDPEYPFYYCEECEFAAHIHCVIDEVIPSMIAEQETNSRPAEVEDGVATKFALVKFNKKIGDLEESIEYDTKFLEIMMVNLEAERTKLEAKVMKLGEMITQLGAAKTELETLKGKRAEFIASKMLSAADKCLSEALTS